MKLWSDDQRHGRGKKVEGIFGLRTVRYGDGWRIESYDPSGTTMSSHELYATEKDADEALVQLWPKFIASVERIFGPILND